MAGKAEGVALNVGLVDWCGEQYVDCALLEVGDGTLKSDKCGFSGLRSRLAGSDVGLLSDYVDDVDGIRPGLRGLLNLVKGDIEGEFETFPVIGGDFRTAVESGAGTAFRREKVFRSGLLKVSSPNSPATAVRCSIISAFRASNWPQLVIVE